jgi:hypothetical protein
MVYGHWITDKGKILDVSDEDHIGVLIRFFNNNTDYQEEYDNVKQTNDVYRRSKFSYALRHLGWIRIINSSPYMEVQFSQGKGNNKSLNALLQLLKENEDKGTLIEIGDKFKKFDSTERGKALRFIREKILGNNKIESSNHAYGYWITNKGKLEEVNYEDHYGFVQKYLVNEGRIVVGVDFVTYALNKMGWIRIVDNSPGEINVQAYYGRTSSQAIIGLNEFLRDHYAELYYLDIRGPRPGDLKDHYIFTDDKSRHLLNTIKRCVGKEEAIASETAIYKIKASDTKSYLVPAIKYYGKIYKAPLGSKSHDDVWNITPGSEEVSDDVTIGFVDDKGRFLKREKAMEYALQNDLLSEKIPDRAKTTKLLVSEWLPSVKEWKKKGFSFNPLKQSIESSVLDRLDYYHSIMV